MLQLCEAILCVGLCPDSLSTLEGWGGALGFIDFCCQRRATGTCPAAAHEDLMGVFQLAPVTHRILRNGGCWGGIVGWELQLSKGVGAKVKSIFQPL